MAAGAPRSEPNAVVAVHGADHPGILAAVTRVLADSEVNVCDLQTRLVERLYVMVIGAAVPEGLPLAQLDARLQVVAAEQGVRLTLNPVETEVL